MKYIHKQSDEQQNMNCPVYETVELNEQTQNVSMSCNIAYGNFTQWSFYYILYYILYYCIILKYNYCNNWMINFVTLEHLRGPIKYI